MLFSGQCQTVLDACFGPKGHQVVLSEHILSEFQRQAGAKLKAPLGKVRRAVEFLRKHVEMIEPVSVSPDACRDPDDLPVLGTALAGRVELLVTGDAHLLELGEFEGISIVSPREFYDRAR